MDGRPTIHPLSCQLTPGWTLLNFAKANDLAPDGKRLAAFVPDNANGEKPFTQLTFPLNFSDELRRKVPAGGNAESPTSPASRFQEHSEEDTLSIQLLSKYRFPTNFGDTYLSI